jgi:PHS family inorganic phosphate transporter-like MFS transporter
MFAGIFSTLLIPETKRRTLEDLAQDWDMGDESITGAEHARKTDNRSSDEAAVNEMKA